MARTIAILTTGTRGDVQPFAALAAALRARGHRVRITAPADLQRLVEASGADFVPLPFSAQDALNSDLGRRFLDSGRVWSFARALLQLDALYRPQLVEAFARGGEDAGLVLVHPLVTAAALAIGKRYAAPLVPVYVGPMVTTRELPSPLFDVDDLGVLNRLSHRLLLETMGRGGATTGRALCAALGVDGGELRGNLFARLEERSPLALHTYSPVLQPRPRDWPASHVQTGMVVLDAQTRARAGEGAPPPGLAAWLDDGPPPVFFGFGSMPVADPARVLALIDEVRDALGVRALVGAGWSDLASTQRRELFVAPAFDHDAVLPRCAAAVHHGGAGTTHTTVRAGLPSVVCHFLVDQPYWARRLIAHGIGARLPFRTLSAGALVDALRPLLSPDVKARAEALGRQLRGEDGVAEAVRLLEPLLPS